MAKWRRHLWDWGFFILQRIILTLPVVAGKNEATSLEGSSMIGREKEEKFSKKKRHENPITEYTPLHYGIDANRRLIWLLYNSSSFCAIFTRTQIQDDFAVSARDSRGFFCRGSLLQLHSFQCCLIPQRTIFIGEHSLATLEWMRARLSYFLIYRRSNLVRFEWWHSTRPALSQF